MLHCEWNLTYARFNYIIDTNIRAFQKTTTLQKEGKLSCASFPYSTSTSVFPKAMLHCEGNLTHSSFHYLMDMGTRISPFQKQCCIINESTNSLPKKTTLHL